MLYKKKGLGIYFWKPYTEINVLSFFTHWQVFYPDNKIIYQAYTYKHKQMLQIGTKSSYASQNVMLH